MRRNSFLTELSSFGEGLDLFFNGHFKKDTAVLLMLMHETSRGGGKGQGRRDPALHPSWR